VSPAGRPPRINSLLWLTVVLALSSAILLVIVLVMASRRTEGTPGAAVAAVVRRPRSKLAESALAQMDAGVIVVNDLGTPVLMNRVAGELLGLDHKKLPPTLSNDAVSAVVRRAFAGESSVSETLDLGPPILRGLAVQATRLDEGVVVVLEDRTEELTSQRLRKQFVSNASHELKSPVAGIQSLAEAIRSAAHDDPATTSRFATKLVQESQRLSRLISELLDLSKLDEPGAISLHSIDLSEVARREVDEVASGARDKGVALTSQIEDRVETYGDTQQIGQMIRNLLENALRYTPRGGNIVLSLDRDGEHIKIEVSDDGIGIPLKHQGRVFERFFRVDEGRDRDSGGTGLGLAIVKHVAELHGGFVALQSQVEEGSTFTITLPLRRSSNGQGGD
jgi:two-component system, OmpR family, phosphate regulon sensor histidine kinase PhoR